MAKSKEQKQLEAKFRQSRGNLIDAYREVEQHHYKKVIYTLLQTDLTTLEPLELASFNHSGVSRRVDKIKKLKEDFSTYPLELQIKAFDGWNTDNLEDLKLFRIEIEKKHLLNKISLQDDVFKNKKRL